MSYYGNRLNLNLHLQGVVNFRQLPYPPQYRISVMMHSKVLNKIFLKTFLIAIVQGAQVY